MNPTKKMGMMAISQKAQGLDTVPPGDTADVAMPGPMDEINQKLDTLTEMVQQLLAKDSIV